MTLRPRWPWLHLLALLLLVSLVLTGGVLLSKTWFGPPRTPPDTPASSGLPPVDQKALHSAIQKDDVKALREFFRKRTLGPAELRTVRAEIQQLGDPSFAVRTRATESLAARGAAITTLLREATGNADTEIASRTRALLAHIPMVSADVISKSLSVLANHPDPETVTVLLDYLPCAESEGLSAEVRQTLGKLASRGGQSLAVLVQALSEDDPVRRLAAALALLQAGVREHQPALRKLLADPDPTVRANLAHAFLDRDDRAGIPVLIDLLPDLAGDAAWALADRLTALAGASAPEVSPGEGAEDRIDCRDAWRLWWRTNGDKIDLKKVRQSSSEKGNTLLVYLTGKDGMVEEIDHQGKGIWHKSPFWSPLSAQWLDEQTFLLTEYGGERVTERNHEGDVKWLKNMDRPVVCARRIDAEHTMIVCRNLVVEVDRAGKERFRYEHPTRSIAAARKLSEGTLVLLTDDGTCLQLDRKNKVRARFSVGGQQNVGTVFDVLPNRSVVVPLYTEDKVVEYSSKGKILWQIAVSQPTMVQRLAGGRTLIGSTTRRTLLEVDRQGKVLWSHLTLPGNPVYMERR